MSRRRRHPLMGLTRRGLRFALRGSRRPRVEGRIEVRGPHARVAILRDRWGVPHVRARDDHDAWFGLGFCQGQDRSFQISMFARAAAGRLSEVVGEQGLGLDRMSRRLGFAARASALLEAQTSEVRGQLEAFAAGVNAGFESGRAKRAPAFVLTRSHPYRLRAQDLAAMLQLQAFGLTGNWETELARWLVLTLDGPEALRDLEPRESDAHPVADGTKRRRGASNSEALMEDLFALRRLVGDGGASNAWAVSGTKSSSGYPMLANDPHMPPTLPSIWYLCQVQTPEWNAAGAAIAGLPGIVSGHNGHGAWGVTAGLCDASDLFIHELDIEGGRTRVGEAWVACERRSETIFVRDAAPVVEEVLETPHGPIITPLLAEPDLASSERAPQGSPRATWPACSMRAMWMEARPILGLLGLHRAHSVDEARAALARWPVMPLGVVWADRKGSIAYVMAAELPRRGRGRGLLPGDAAEPATGWTSIVPGEAMPTRIDPPEGFVVAANHRPSAAESPELGSDWLEGFRAARIAAHLAATETWDLLASMRLQVDQTVGVWPELWRVLGPTLSTPDLAEIHGLLDAWDGRAMADAPAAAVHELWWANMCRRVANARAPKTHAWALGRPLHPLAPASHLALRRTQWLLELLRTRPEGWFEGGWDAQCRAAMREVHAELVATYGPEPKRWRWGAVRPLTLEHPLGQAVPALAPLFNRGPYPWGGDSHTVGQASVTPLAPKDNPMVIAGLRTAIDLGEVERSRFCIAGGQSGNPLSPHYDTFVDLWLRGQGIPIAHGAAAVERAAVHRLTLLPAGS